MEKVLKYQDLISNQPLHVDCPGKANEENINAYRFSFDPADNPNNFLPNLIEDDILGKPARRLVGDEKHCEACGLSFYDDLTKAIIALKLFKRLKHTHIANGLLCKEDGLKGETNHSGHFVFFEYHSASLISKFSTVYQR